MPASAPWIIDAHLDLSLNRRRYGRDITLPLDQLRLTPGACHPRWGTPTVSIPAMVEGGVGIAFATLLALTRSPGHAEPLGECESMTPLQARDTARRDIAFYHEIEAAGCVRVINDRCALERHAAEWDNVSASRRPGLVLMMEGAEPILSPADLPRWREWGLRIVAPAWYGLNRYAHGTGTPGGLTALGRDFLRELEQHGLILDVSHLAEQAFFEALDAFGGPVIASHSNARALAPGDRQLSDDMIRQLTRRGGVVGVVMDGWMLVPGWERGQANTGLTLARVADHIDHVCQLTGDARHVAIGSDLDGGFGREQVPEDLDSIADLPRLFEVLAGRGFDAETLTAIAHANWLGVLRAAWPKP